MMMVRYAVSLIYFQNDSPMFTYFMSLIFSPGIFPSEDERLFLNWVLNSSSFLSGIFLEKLIPASMMNLFSPAILYAVTLFTISCHSNRRACFCSLAMVSICLTSIVLEKLNSAWTQPVRSIQRFFGRKITARIATNVVKIQRE